MIGSAPRVEAVLVVDVQNDFCHPRGALPQQLDLDLSHIQRAVTPLTRLLAAARTHSVPVGFVRTLYPPLEQSEAMLAHWKRRGLAPYLTSEGWGSDFLAGVEPAAGDLVFTKHRQSAFHETKLKEELQQLGVTSVYCAGVLTATCVEGTARDAFATGFHTAVVADACGEYDPEMHERSLTLMQRSVGPITTVDEVVAHWSQQKASCWEL